MSDPTPLLLRPTEDAAGFTVTFTPGEGGAAAQLAMQWDVWMEVHLRYAH